MWQHAMGAEDDRDREGLLPGEHAELIFSMANPLDTEVAVTLDPSVFNPLKGNQSQFTDDIGSVVQEQNVEVLTGPFSTTMSRFNDLADVHDVYDEESEKTKNLKGADDPDVIPERKMHKILVRIRFTGCLDTGGDQTQRPWIFFARLGLVFTDHTSTKHSATVIMRFASEKPSCKPFAIW